MGIMTNLDMCGIKYINLLNEIFQIPDSSWLLLNKFGEPHRGTQ